MKTSEKIYTALILCLVGLLVISIANFQLILIPRIEKPGTIQVFQFVCVVLGVMTVALGATALINLKQKELGMVPTVIQIINLFIFAYGIPLAIWGIVLLVKKNKNANPSSEPILQTPVE